MSNGDDPQGMAWGRRLYALTHTSRAQVALDDSAKVWTLDELLNTPSIEGRCLWAAEHGNTSARDALKQLREVRLGQRSAKPSDPGRVE